ncbi:hypothetical protein QTH93_11330 [Variovorax sp. J2R1-6]|nr:hypothetical protein [Variovorax sp. J2R1-6]MDM0233227.1 hypothetical protein [Variovorax sp. J2R1-6]
MAAQADDALPQTTAAKRPAANTLLDDLLPRALQSSLVATQAPSDSFQIDLYVLFMCLPSSCFNCGRADTADCSDHHSLMGPDGVEHGGVTGENARFREIAYPLLTSSAD